MNSNEQVVGDFRPRMWTDWFRDVFTFDLRSLAVFRMCAGSILLWDLIFRAQSFSDMYAQDGVVTRDVSRDLFRMLVSEDVSNAVWSLYWLSDATAYQAALFIIAGVFALMLTFGAWTRVATIGSWVMLVSLHARNPLVQTSGDFLLKMCLFWCIFLPWGALWSVDAARRRRSGMPKPRLQLASFATAGFMLQLMLMYFFTGVAKMNSDWFSGEAMYYVLRLDIYITDFGKQLLDYRALLALVSWATLFIEVVMIWAMLSSWQNSFFRWLNLLAYWAFHIGIALSMSIGLFPLICIIAWVPLIPVSFWDLVMRSSRQDAESAPRGLDQRLLVNWVCALMITFLLLWNIFNIPNPTIMQIGKTIGWKHAVVAGYVLRVDQHFQMFGRPPRTNPWFVYEATLANGDKVDLMRNREVEHERPTSVRRSLPGHHWRKLHRNLVEPEYKEMRPVLANYWVAKWNREHSSEQQVDKLRLICYLENTGPDYNEANRRSQVWGSYVNPNRNPSNIIDELDKLEDDPLMGF